MDPELYLKVREKEGRIHSDQVVARLPFMPDGDPFADEWRARSASASRLVRYLTSWQKPIRILDLGCGNGWLSNLLAGAGPIVIGFDQNHHEMKQARRVFQSNPKLSFLEGDIFSAPFHVGSFDMIVLASVLQYFQDACKLLSVLLNYLKPQGEIHILDTSLYLDGEVEKAKVRSREYYTSLGFPEMSEHYFHHCVSDFHALSPVTFYRPHQFTLRLKRLIGQVDSPFQWVVLRKQN